MTANEGNMLDASGWRRIGTGRDEESGSVAELTSAHLVSCIQRDRRQCGLEGEGLSKADGF